MEWDAVWKGRYSQQWQGSVDHTQQSVITHKLPESSLTRIDSWLWSPHFPLGLRQFSRLLLCL